MFSIAHSSFSRFIFIQSVMAFRCISFCLPLFLDTTAVGQQLCPTAVHWRIRDFCTTWSPCACDISSTSFLEIVICRPAHRLTP